MHNYRTNIIIKIYFFIFSLLLILPMVELFQIDGPLDDGDMEIYITLILISMILTFVVLYRFNYFKSINGVYFDNIYSKKFIIFIALVSFIWFMFFIIKNIYSFSVVDMVAFAEGYRNGLYSGSGVYTAPILIVVPSFLLLIIMKQIKLDYSFYISFLLVFIAASLVGLRIYLFGIIIFSLHRAFIKVDLKKVVFLLIMLFAILVLFKYFLNDAVKNMSSLDMLMYILSRLDYRTLLEFKGFEIGFEQLKYIFDFPTITHFKEIFFSYNNDISYGMPSVSLWSGIALLLPVLLYNVIYIFMPPFVVLYILFTMSVLKKIITTKSLILSSFLVNLYFIQILILIEDFAGIVKLPVLFILSFFMILALKISKIKIHTPIFFIKISNLMQEVCNVKK